jgi:hypothetical protein
MIPEIWEVKEHPILKRLPTALAIFAFEFLDCRLSRLPDPSLAGGPTVLQANSVLEQYLLHRRDGKHLHTFSCLKLELKGLD